MKSGGRLRMGVCETARLYLEDDSQELKRMRGTGVARIDTSSRRERAYELRERM